MMDIMDDYKYVTIDTEFPGIVLEPVEQLISVATWNYMQMRANVNALKIIQLGITFTNDVLPGENAAASRAPCWQFNFEFDLSKDTYACDAIELLKSAGLDFEKHRTKGIRPEEFGEKVIPSGLVLSDDVRWISFHGLYDFGYLLKVLTSSPLPDDGSGFFDLLDTYFPQRCDIKYLMREEFRGGLACLGTQLGLSRIGAAHQGGSDSILTAQVFSQLSPSMKERAFDKTHHDCGGLFGLSNDERHAYHGFGGRSRDRSTTASGSPREHSTGSLTPTLSYDYNSHAAYASAEALMDANSAAHGVESDTALPPIPKGPAPAPPSTVPSVPMPQRPPPPPPGAGS